MSREKFQHVNIIFDRLKSKLLIEKDVELAKILNISPGKLGVWRTRNFIPFELLITLCRERGININWLLTGEEPMEREKGLEVYAQAPASMIEEEKEAKYGVDMETERVITLLKDMDAEKRRDILKIIELLSVAPALTEEEAKWLNLYRKAQNLSPDRFGLIIRILEGVFKEMGLIEKEEKLWIEKKKAV